MTNTRSREHPRRLVPIGAALAGGGLLAVVSTGLLMSFGPPIIAILLAGIAIFLPTLLVRDFRRYWLWGYLFFLPFELGLRVTGRGQNVEELINTIGLPPSTFLGLKIFPTDLVLVALLLAWVLALKARKETFHFPKTAWLLVAFLAWQTLSSVLKAEDLHLSFVQLLQEYKYFVVFLFFVSILKSHRRVGFVATVVLLGLGMELFFSLGLFAIGHSRDSLAESLRLGVSHDFEFLREQEKEMATAASLRASGTFGAASHLAMYLQLASPVALGLAFASRQRRTRLLCGGLFVGAALAMFLSLSRTGLLGFAVGTTVMVLLLKVRGLISNRQFLALGFLGLTAIAIQGPLLYRHLSSRPETFYHRLTLFQEGGGVIAANPFLGVGTNHSTLARIQYAESHYRVSRASGMTSYDNLYPIHNQYIVIAAESGLVGIALGAAFFVLVALRALRLVGARDPTLAALAAAVLAGFVGLAAQLMGDHFVGNAQHTMLWMATALVFAMERIDAPARTENRTPAGGMPRGARPA